MEPKFLVGLWTVLRGTWWALHQLPFLLPAPPTAAGSLARLLTVRAQRLAFEAAAEPAFAWDRGPWWLGRVGWGFGGGAIGSGWWQKQPRARGKSGLRPPQFRRAPELPPPARAGEGGLLTGSRKTSWRRAGASAPSALGSRAHLAVLAPGEATSFQVAPGGRTHHTARSLGSEKSCFCFPSA